MSFICLIIWQWAKNNWNLGVRIWITNTNLVKRLWLLWLIKEKSIIIIRTIHLCLRNTEIREKYFVISRLYLLFVWLYLMSGFFSYIFQSQLPGYYLRSVWCFVWKAFFVLVLAIISFDLKHPLWIISKSKSVFVYVFRVYRWGYPIYFCKHVCYIYKSNIQ